MSVDPTTYHFCIESLRYIHKIIGYDAILKELQFIQHLHVPSSMACAPQQAVENVIVDKPMEQAEQDVPIDTVVDEPKVIVIDPKLGKPKYVRSVLLNEERCEMILPTGNRCTLRRKGEGVHCGHHSQK
jgi:hypothetical protein